ncbi:MULTISPECIES: 2-phospho-L-lactate guanylyltransferase [Parafrankia]|uniref:Phosphoenolpyruvate guanylyltransferase n=1 Tax=Parafrankia colletiae TaxID=573497 RepID=A0A1S1RD58_9ACTN|nr:2-phospho-L-lactate guanylyltransferase [Parafrankia colletiae]MCK9901104.1 2-phospho-L-lactate guanylyltransferase [Frankia sp. Cpl3]OHV44017.1 2-phospho-L-lactate guanylyltransferase [Parafrankia colletiae]
MQPAESTPPWVALVPLKPLGAAKSRLDHPARRSLALAMALDTAAAVLDAGSDAVGALIVVTDDRAARDALTGLARARGLAERLLVTADEPRGGLNPAFAHAAALARVLYPGWGTAALSADLPALRPQQVRRALAAAPVAGHGVLADAAGTGTVLLSAAAGTDLHPRFGPGSFAAHRDSGAVDLTLLLTDQVPGLRRDVDTVADLAVARALGLGPATSSVLAAAPSPRSAA